MERKTDKDSSTPSGHFDSQLAALPIAIHHGVRVGCSGAAESLPQTVRQEARHVSTESRRLER